MPPSLKTLAAALQGLAPHYTPDPDDPLGVWAPGSRPVRRLGWAVEPTPAALERARQADVDAILLHRPWRLDAAALKPGVGVLAMHKALDDRFSVGWSPALAASLELEIEGPPLHYKDRRIGFVGRLAEGVPFDVLRDRLDAAFGGSGRVLEPRLQGPVERVAAVGAFTAALVREAAARGVGLYLTGQLRQPGREAAAETGLGVVAVGQARAERWGLRWVAAHLAERFGVEGVDLEA